MAYVTEDQARTWGVSAEQVLAAGRANLAALGGLGPAGGTPTVLRMLDDGNGYFVSRLLVDGWLAGLEARVGGRPVAFAVDNNTLMVAADEPDALVKLLELVERDYDEAPRAISPQPYTVDSRGAVVPYSVPAGHPLTGPLARTAALLAGNEYGSQTAWLNEEYERDGIDVFVGRLLVAERNGKVITLATWARGADSLLPEAQYVSMGGGEETSFVVAWSTLEREIDLVPVPDLDPPRYRMRTWPPDAIVERLRAAAVVL
jgi:hypothetical protein